MRIKYSPEVDILVIQFTDNPVYESEHLAEEGIVIDYDKNNDIARVEIFDWSQRREAEVPITGKFVLSSPSM
ncbi:conserved hypothetical protein [Thermosulfidibacter takaii ABI70S6]|jgi:uncharacterized protein YuzE|uniref:DUF2283 domain-containing protein n=1 Tax=Thermosulfidibacter takaii (strain DSM 17441 / JCM 13301 / NBRC 103674 / ABI70S6) TaxID=1298851 RepID=A0A0S3QUE9_THET7|nr:DUF2283 domain-containing protein [Thermosulfidibacter takaii]BAT71953.1 conserved hypothetical protein [Thermosulfidibacter takaii ABI70S6]